MNGGGARGGGNMESVDCFYAHYFVSGKCHVIRPCCCQCGSVNASNYNKEERVRERHFGREGTEGFSPGSRKGWGWVSKRVGGTRGENKYSTTTNIGGVKKNLPQNF